MSDLMNANDAKPFWASQTIWSAIAVVGSSATGAWLAWRASDMAAFGAAQAALARTNAQVADLERARDQLQETYDALLAQTIRDPAGGLLCLGPGLVRALDALGRDGGAPGAGP